MLKIQHLTQSFPGQPSPVLNNLSLALEAGDFCVVIGSNGSGKSTLLKTLLGEYPTKVGNIFLHDKNISHQPLYQRAKNISAVFQDVLRGTIAEMTVAENLNLALMRTRKATFKPYTKHHALFARHLSHLQMGLENYLDTPCQSLSGGQRQAVAFAMATLHSPRLLLLDEHCSALDPKSSRHIMENTAQFIQRFAITTLMVTHNIRDALTYGNRLVMLHQGEIVFEASGVDKQRLSKEYVLQLFHRHEDEMLLGDGVTHLSPAAPQGDTP